MVKWDKVVSFLSAAPLARIGVSAIVTPVLGLFFFVIGGAVMFLLWL